MQRARDRIVIGCSAGGVEMLPRLLQPIPTDIRASITIVQHLAVSPAPMLADILQRATPLPVAWAEQGARLEYGHVYVAPPGAHLLHADDHLALTRTAPESHARPSINKLFRSAAAAAGSNVIGVLLTGMLEDGVAGLRAIQAAGGIALVQDPDEAPFPDLPRHALLAMAADRVLPILGISTALVMLSTNPVPSREVPPEVVAESTADLDDRPDLLRQLGPQSSVSCPDCHGPTWEIGDPYERRYRCYLGHVNSGRELLVHTALEIEAALWSAVRALGDRATTLETLADDARRTGRPDAAELYAQRATQTREQIDLARRFLMDLVTG